MKYKIIEEMDGWAICVRKKLSWIDRLFRGDKKKVIWAEIAKTYTRKQAKRWIKKHKRVCSQKVTYIPIDALSYE